MSDVTITGDIGTDSQPIPAAELAPWAIFATLLVLLAVYFVGAEQGATSMFNGTNIHEYFHDARHLLGFPCH